MELAVQQAVNAEVGRVSSPWIATFNNFLVGTTVVASRYGNNGASNSGGNGTTGTNGTVTWNIGALNAGQARVLLFSGALAPTAPAQIGRALQRPAPSELRYHSRCSACSPVTPSATSGASCSSPTPARARRRSGR